MTEDKIMIEQVDLRRHRQETEVRTEEISRRKTHFLGLGFARKWVDALKEVRPTLYAPEVVNSHINGLADSASQIPTK